MRHRHAVLLTLLVTVLVFLSAPLSSADDAPRWIVVHAPAFGEAIEPLCEHRRAQGFEVVKLDAHDLLGTVAAERGIGLPVRMRLLNLCRERPEATSVLLVGAFQGKDLATVVPALKGGIGRMKGKPTDNGYGCLDKDRLPDVAVGRFPARTVEEARAMVAKTIAFEELDGTAPWCERITLLIGHPGGDSPMVRSFAAGMVDREIRGAFRKVHPRWRVGAVFHMDNSAFYVPDDRLADAARSALGVGQLLTIYLGHSGAKGLWSGETFLTRDDLEQRDWTPRAGILLSCGCHACEISGWHGQGYAFAAVRNPKGFVASIGAHGASYGAMGKLAFEGLLPHLAAERPPHRLGAWWLAMKQGLATGHIGKLVFQLYDRADGSNGKVPLEVQREEHLEMWMLLGDPALRLPVRPPGLALRVDGEVKAGATLVVRGHVTSGAATTVHVGLERPFGTDPVGLPPLPRAPAEARDEVARDRFERAHRLEIAGADAEVKEGRFEARVVVPAPIPWDRLVLRAVADDGAKRVALSLPVAR